MKFRSFFRFVFVLCLVTLLVPFSAEAAEIIASGTCGDHVTWTLDSDKVLTLAGTGEMDDYANSGAMPWANLRSKITTIVIADGMTDIGDGAFYGMGGITKVSIANSVTHIGINAFNSCYGLQSIFLPDSVVYIGDGAFAGCWNLTSFRVPDKVTVIGNSTFSGCSKLEEIIIPNGVTSIGSYAFSGCKCLTSIAIPSSVKQIKGGAFSNCSGLTNVTIPEGVTAIESSTFRECRGLTYVSIPDSVTTIGSQAFDYCVNMYRVTLPQNLTSIGLKAFGCCLKLNKLTIPGKVTFLSRDAFYACHNLDLIWFEGDVPEMEDSPFREVGATFYYPDHMPSWEEYIKATYKGSNWKPYTLPMKNVAITKVTEHASGNILYWNAVNGAKLYQVYRLIPGNTQWTLLANTGSLAYKDTSAQIGVTYYYKIIARDGSRKSSIADTAHASATRPYPLASVKMTKILGHKTGNIVYWEAVDGADLYQVFRRAENESGWTLIKNTRSLAYKDESAALGVKYYYKVRARNGDLMSSLDITALAAVRPYPLASVKMTKAVGHATGNIIYWEAVENAKIYQVYRRAANESGWTLIKNTGSLAYKDTDAQSGVKYYYKVVARNGEKRSSMDIPAVSATRP